MDLIDIGANLTNKRLYSQLQDTILNAKNAGVVHQIITGTCLDSSEQALQISKSHPNYLSSTAGCHPHDAKDFKVSDQKLLEQLSQHQEVVAIGECGLDFNRNFSPQDTQQKVFETQIEIACKVNLPLFMHQRDAHKRFVEILSRYKGQFKSGVIHCFTGDKEQLKDCLDLGLHIGITGWICDQRRSAELQEAVKYLPLDRMMIETDAPYLLPRNIKPKPKSSTNVPANLPWVLKRLAELLNTDAEIIAQQTTNNARTFFSLTI
ncbi:MAG: hydrolase TatD [Gammaproteobacteria bacterium]|nr:MAG: hydrolase TatD [Gammaproteobacteria bacterium]